MHLYKCSCGNLGVYCFHTLVSPLDIAILWEDAKIWIVSYEDWAGGRTAWKYLVMSASLALEKEKTNTSKSRNERRPCCFKEIFLGIC